VRRVVLEASKKVDISYDDGVNRRTQVWLVGFGDSSLNFELVVWLNPKLGRAAPGSWKAIYTWEIETALKENNIEIPFPQRDLHIKSGLKEAIKPEAI
jgi:small-conductance mechanosensitive channel